MGIIFHFTLHDTSYMLYHRVQISYHMQSAEYRSRSWHDPLVINICCSSQGKVIIYHAILRMMLLVTPLFAAHTHIFTQHIALHCLYIPAHIMNMHPNRLIVGTMFPYLVHRILICMELMLLFTCCVLFWKQAYINLALLGLIGSGLNLWAFKCVRLRGGNNVLPGILLLASM